MRAPIAAAALAVALAFAGCGNGGPKVTQTRDVGSFDAIVLQGGLDLEVASGPRPAVQVTAARKVIGRVKTELHGTTLVVSAKRKGIVIGSDSLHGAKVRVTAPHLTSITLQGAGDAHLTGLSGQRVQLRLEGSGDLEASGRVDELSTTMQGSGDARLGKLAARRAMLTMQGSGDAELSVSDTLDVQVQGSGDVTYHGHPHVNSSVQGSGDVTPAD